MIVFDKLWETMDTKGVTVYTLREKHGIDHKTIKRLKKTEIQKSKPLTRYAAHSIAG